MPAYMAVPWLYSVVTAGAPLGSDARLQIDDVLGLDPDAEAEIQRRRVAAIAAAGGEVG